MNAFDLQKELRARVLESRDKRIWELAHGIVVEFGARSEKNIKIRY